jgi:hypothetical protein
MKKLLPIIALFLIITGCSTVTESPTAQLNVIETWTGYAKGRGGDCSDAEVRLMYLTITLLSGRHRSPIST